MTPRRHCWRTVLVGLAAYTIVFAIALRDWLPHCGSILPAGIHLTDSEFSVWVLGWVAEALATAPGHLFDAPFNHPAPGQLAGMDWFGTSNLVSAPVYWLTGNALLAGSAVVLLSYPLAAIAMASLLGAMGCTPLVAWLGGFVSPPGRCASR